MNEGQYRIVRFSPDPIRDEPLNIGIVMVGNFDPLVSFPEDSIERAGRWCRTLDPQGLADLRDALESELQRAALRADDLDGALRPDFLGERFGPITLSEPRWVSVESSDDVRALFSYLTDRIVRPPRPVVHGGGTAPARKLARSILPAIRRSYPLAKRNEPFVGHSGRPFMADIYAPGRVPLVLSTLVPSSTTQGVHTVEAKAFEMYDVGRSVLGAKLAVCCSFPPVDPRGIRKETEAIFRSIDVRVVTPESLDALSLHDGMTARPRMN